MQAPHPEVQSIVNKSVSQFDCGSPALLARFLSEVLEWNPTLGLVSKREPVAACERLVLESLELAQLLNLRRARVADVGSGAGFPGVVWALNLPELEVTMIERREKRALFLERTCRTLPLTNATAVALDARDAARSPDYTAAFDLVVTMAVGDPAAMAHTIEPLLKNPARFASTIAATASAPGVIGSNLHLERRLDGEFGCYAIYRSGV
jgi:16S rRNA (guanine527-N7)-methyltransferase